MPKPGKGQTRQLRIIAGQWRGRKLNFEPATGLRPTTDRIRETLFNWLSPHIHGARCADLFAGSGALGLEALSRGALHCDFVDTSASATRQIGRQLEILDAQGRADCHCADAVQFLAQAERGFNLVFVDPPFGGALAASTCQALGREGILLAGALVYVETASTDPAPAVPETWSEYRSKATGGVNYRLYLAP